MKAIRSRAPLRRVLLYAVFFSSGIAGLGYQMAWTRMFTVGLGHEMPSVLAVVAAFFGGFALGAWVLDGPVSRSRQPAMWYAGLEFVIAVWGLVSMALIPLANDAALRWIGAEPSPARQWAVAFLVPLLALLPATAAMGATLPAMERAVTQSRPGTRCVGGLYAVNTLGAVAGIILIVFVLLPTLGARFTILTLAALSIICACVALAIAGGQVSEPKKAMISLLPPVGTLRLGVSVLATGLLGIGYEVLGVRVLSQVTQNTVFSFAAALVAYLTGTAVGAALYQRVLARRAAEHFHDIMGTLLILLCAACLTGVIVMRQALEIEQKLRAFLGNGMAGAVAAELLLGMMVFGLPTLVMGVLFSHLVQAARTDRGGVGRAVAVNTLGGALAPAVFGVILLPVLRAKWALTMLALSYLPLIPRFSQRLLVGLAAPLLLLISLPADLRIVAVPKGGRLIAFREGVMASVAVVEDARGARALKVNNRFMMGGTEGGFCERRLAAIPLLLHVNPRTALFLGVGTGVSFGAAAMHPRLAADGVELIPEVVDVLGQFEPANDAPHRQPNLRLRVADARRFVRASDRTYDVIVGDLFHPARDGAGSLYTLEHFQAVRARLNSGGLYCQWLPMYQLDQDMLRVIVRTFLQAFPDTRAYLGHFNVNAPMLALVGTLQPTVYKPDQVETRMMDGRLAEQLQTLALTDSYRLFGCLLADSQELARYSESASLNTDDHPVVVFGAPRFTYLAKSTPWDRLMPFIGNVSGGVYGLLSPEGSPHKTDDFSRRVRDYIAARNLYLNGMIAAAEGRGDEALEACIESARISGDFTTGYVTVLEAVRTMVLSDTARARRLLRRLVEVRPEISAARNALRQLSDE